MKCQNKIDKMPKKRKWNSNLRSLKNQTNIIEIPETSSANVEPQEIEHVPQVLVPSYILLFVSLDHLNSLIKTYGALCPNCKTNSLFFEPTSNVGISTFLTLKCTCGQKKGAYIMPK